MYNNFNFIDFNTTKPTKNDIEMLKDIKLKTILTDTSSTISQEEKDKIIKYVNDYIEKNYTKYNLIIFNKIILGAYCIDSYNDGLLLDEIYIFPDYRNKGIASKVIINMQNTSNENIYLWVYKSNKVAFNLYTKLGFHIEDETETRYLMKYNKEIKNRI